MKNRLKGAHTGHSLLKRKSEALTRRFREIVKKIDEVCSARQDSELMLVDREPLKEDNNFT